MKPLKEVQFPNTIIFTKIIDDNTIIVVDSKSTLYYIDLKTFNITKTFNTKINHTRYETNVVSLSSDGDTFVSLSEDAKSIVLFDLKNKTKKEISNRHHGEISCVTIDPKNRYVVTSGEDGKIFAIDMLTNKLAFNLPVHVDTVNDIVFSTNAQWIATASYDKKISLYNIVMMKLKFRLKVHKAPVAKVHFLSKYRLFSVDRDSVGIIWSMHDSSVIKRIEGIHDDVVQITTDLDSSLLFLGTKLGYVLVYDLDTYELIDRRFIKLTSSITSMSFDLKDNKLIISTKNSKLYLFDIYEGRKQIIQLLKEQKYKEVEEFIKENKILKYTSEYKEILMFWEEALAKAKEYLGKNDKTKAQEIFEKFISIPSRKQTIDKLFKEYDEFEKFMVYVSQAKYYLAYSLLSKYPVYKESLVYKSMEIKWRKAFAQAQQTLTKTKSIDKAKEILAPFRGVSEKTKLIQDLLQNANIHERFKASFIKKDYKICFELVKLHQFLKEYKEYHDLQNVADSLYIQSQKLLQQGEKYSAIKLLNILLDFDEFKDDAKNMIIEIQDNL